jgi:RNA polymerase sigma-70 factor, ECF subfamily
MAPTEQQGGPAADPDFAQRLERHRRELRVHCYRMLGSLDESEDLVQETFLRAWRSRDSFEDHGPASFRAWLYKIATNACLDVLRGRSARVMPQQVVPAGDPSQPPAPPADLPWLQPYPDALLEPAAAAEEEPGAVVVARETIELAFLAAIQHLPPRQRAALILRDVLGWSAKDTASLLEVSVAAANSALQRARATMQERLPERTEWSRAAAPTQDERELLRRYVDAHERADADGLAALLREDALLAMPPHPTWYDGREAIMTAMQPAFTPEFGSLRSVLTAANTQPAVAHYLRAPGDTEHRALAMDVLRIEDGRIAEISSFPSAELFAAFGLPATLD